MFGMGFGELAVIAVLGLLLFGSRLPGLMRNLGQGVVQFKKGLRETQDDIERAALGEEKK